MDAPDDLLGDRFRHLDGGWFGGPGGPLEARAMTDRLEAAERAFNEVVELDFGDWDGWGVQPSIANLPEAFSAAIAALDASPPPPSAGDEKLREALRGARDMLALQRPEGAMEILLAALGEDTP